MAWAVSPEGTLVIVIFESVTKLSESEKKYLYSITKSKINAKINEEEVEEATTTANVDGYGTPFAFSGGRKKDKEKRKKIATQAGYTQISEISKITSLLLKKLDEFISKDDLKNMVGDEISVKLKNKTRKVVITDVRGDKVTIMDKGSSIPATISTKQLMSIMESRLYELNSGDVLNHKHQDGLTITLVSPTNKGWKVKQRETHQGWSGKKLRKPKEKTAFFSDSEIKDLFESYSPVAKQKAVNRRHELRNNEDLTPKQKIGVGIREMRRQLSEIEKFVRWYNEIKTENDMTAGDQWKRTNKHLMKIKERIIRIAKNIQELDKWKNLN